VSVLKGSFSVIPAHAGVILTLEELQIKFKGNSRTRGGDPTCIDEMRAAGL